jgi:hypothetical protein
LFLTDVNENKYLYSNKSTINRLAPHIAKGCKKGFANAKIPMKGMSRIPSTLLIMKTTKI